MSENKDQTKGDIEIVVDNYWELWWYAKTVQ